MENNTKDEIWWKPGIIMFLRVSIWVGVPIICSLYIGKFFDNRYGTDPWIFLSLTAIAFIISMFGIWKMLRKYIKDLEDEIKEKKNLEKNQNGESN